MIIDFSYFIGQLYIPSLDKTPVQLDVSRYIIQYENEYLTRILGFQLAEEFITGLQQPVIAQKWVDLLVGTTYQSSGYNSRRWQGLAKTFSNFDVNTTEGSFAWIVGTPGSPVTGTNTFTDKRLIGKVFTIEQRGFGTMLRLNDPGVTAEDADYSFSTDGTITLTKEGENFEGNSVYLIHVKGYTGITDYSDLKISPIAYYIYYHYVRDNVSTLTSHGVRTTKTENAIPVSPEDKLRLAWNNMVEINKQLVEYLQASSLTYGYYFVPYETMDYSNHSYDWLGYPSRAQYRNRIVNELLEKIHIHGV